MRRNERLSGIQIILWTGLGLGAGLVAGFTLSEWIGGVSSTRMRGVARRLRQAAPTRLTTSASAQAVDAALTLAGRTALATAGIESVIHRRLVRGEDDVQRGRDSRATDQSA